MAKSWHYPRWRRTVMQVVLWVVFGATVGVAALVVHRKDRPGSRTVDLSTPVTARGMPVRVRLPVGWEQELGADGADTDGGDVVVVARLHEPPEPEAEPGPPTAGRMLVIRYEQVARPLPTAVEYLMHGPLAGTRQRVDRHGDTAADVPVTVAGLPGRLVTSGQPGQAAIYAAAAVAPNGLVVTVVLDDPPPGQDADANRKLVRDVAGGIEIVARP